jgi:glycosyltransferase involved in cell wall biosynthesis
VKPRHIALEALAITPGKTGGVETYTRGLVAGLLEVDPALRVTLFVRREAAGAGWNDDPRVTIAAIDVPPRHARIAPLLQTWVPWQARRRAVDVLHHVAWYGTWTTRRPTVVTIHDLITRRFYDRPPLGERSLRARLRDAFLALSARRATRVIVPSAAVRDELGEELGIPPSRVDVTHEAPKLVARRGHERGAAPVLARHGLRADAYVLTVSRFLPHKNLERLIDAHLRAELPHVLAIAGVPDFPAHGRAVVDRIRAEVAASPRRDTIRFLGCVDDDELHALYRGARAFAWPSLAEGFGLPPLEAMEHGAPVIASDIPVLREILGDGASLFVADSRDDAIGALRRVCTDEGLRARLRARGEARVKRYTWRRTAEATLAAYARAMAAT